MCVVVCFSFSRVCTLRWRARGICCCLRYPSPPPPPPSCSSGDRFKRTYSTLSGQRSVHQWLSELRLQRKSIPGRVFSLMSVHTMAGQLGQQVKSSQVKSSGLFQKPQWKRYTPVGVAHSDLAGSFCLS